MFSTAVGGFWTRSSVSWEYRRVAGDVVIIPLIRRIKNSIDRTRCGFYRGQLPAIANAHTDVNSHPNLHPFQCTAYRLARRRLSSAFTAAPGKLFSFHFVLVLWCLASAPGASRRCPWSDIIRYFPLRSPPPSLSPVTRLDRLRSGIAMRKNFEIPPSRTHKFRLDNHRSRVRNWNKKE